MNWDYELARAMRPQKQGPPGLEGRVVSTAPLTISLLNGEAVKQWFELALRQQIDRIPIYRTQGTKKYGVPRDLIGGKLPQGLAAAEMERGVRETASYNPAVREIRELRLSRERRTCVVEFTAVLHTGESVEVSVDVQRG